MRVWRATPKTDIFWHCALQTHAYTFVGIFGAEVCAFGTPHKQHPCLALCVSNTCILGIQRYSCWQVWCRGICLRRAYQTHTFFWRCVLQTRYPKALCIALLVQGYVCSVCHTTITHFLAFCISNTHTKYPKTSEKVPTLGSEPRLFRLQGKFSTNELRRTTAKRSAKLFWMLVLLCVSLSFVPAPTSPPMLGAFFLTTWAPKKIQAPRLPSWPQHRPRY